MEEVSRSLQADYVAALTRQVEGDGRVLAAWLEGSLGRGNADRYSDVDAHLLIDPDAAESFAQGAREWLDAVTPLVLFRTMFDGRMLNGVTRDGLRIDVWTHPGTTAPVREGKTVVLLDRGDHLQWTDGTPAPRPQAETVALLERQFGEFWRCISNLPAAIGRGELIVALIGLTVEVGPLVDVLLVGEEIVRESGMKTLNQYLPAPLRQEIESALDLKGLTVEELTQAHLRLAAIMQRRGLAIAERFGASYPTDLENAVVAYVSEELRALGRGGCLREWDGP